MPRELIAAEPRTPVLREYEEPPLGPEEVRVASELTAVKHGTELRKYRGETRDFSAPFDWERRLHADDGEPLFEYPTALGNVTVGTVAAVGSDVTAFAPGDRVFGHLPVRETHAVPAEDLRALPDELSTGAAVYGDPARVGLHLVRDGGVRVGDAIAVVGAGAIGQMAAQIARSAGADPVIVSDPVARRREAALDHGADRAFDPGVGDVVRRLKDGVTAGEEPGVDVALETSGAYPGLDDAVRAVAFGGTVASCGYYAGDASGLRLEGEWHRNAVDLRSVRPPSEPLRDHPRWDLDRLQATALGLLRESRLSAEGLLDPVVDISGAPEGMRLIDSGPEGSIKLAVRY